MSTSRQGLKGTTALDLRVRMRTTAKSPPPRGIISPRRPSIAVVEDNPADVYLIKQALTSRKLNVDVRLVSDGEMAISLIAEIEADETIPCPQLLLLDLNLPKRTGFEVLDRLRNSTKCSAVPVVIMSSSGASADMARSASLKASAYFKKPSGYDDFLKIGDIVRQLLA